MLRLLLALLLMAVPAASSAAPATAVAAAPDEKHAAEQRNYAMALILKGQPQRAIDQYLDPLLARYDAGFAGDERRIYGARTTAETMLYMLEAATAKRGAVALGPGWGDTLYAKGFALVDLGKHAEARAFYERAVALSPSNARYIAELGNLDQQARDWPRALETFQRAIAAAELSPPDEKQRELTRAMRGAGFALIELERFDEAEALYRKCLALDPGDKVARTELAYIAGKRAKAGRAVPTT